MSDQTKTFCPECGFGVPVDEDGCCVTCGATATGPAVDELVQPGEPVGDLLVFRSSENVEHKRCEARIREEKRVQLLQHIGRFPLYLAPPERDHKFEPWMVEWLSGFVVETNAHPKDQEHAFTIAAAIQDILKGGPEDG